MLIIWTTAEASLIRNVIGPIVGRQQVAHRVESDITKIPFMEDGDVLLACGGRALATLLSLGLVPKGRTITSLRDRAIPASRGSVFVTFDPIMVQKEYARLPEIQWDVQLAIRMHTTGSTKPPIGTYRYVESLHEMIERIDANFERTGKPTVVTSDLETLGLDEYNPEAWIIACSFTDSAGMADVLYFDKGECPIMMRDNTDQENYTYWEGLWAQLHWLFSSPKVTLRGANFKYDSRWIFKKWGIDVTNLKMDTLLVGSLLDENRSNSLKLHAKIYTPMGGYEDDMKQEMSQMGIDMSRLDLMPKKKLLPYVGGDTDATYQVAEVLRGELVKDRKLADFYVKILHPSSKVFEKMERTGVCLDIPYYHKLQNELENEIDRLDILMKKMIPRKLAIKYADNFSLTRPALMREFLFTPAGLNLKATQKTEKSGEASTAMDHLMTFEDVPEAKAFIDLLKESNSASKTLSTFVVGFLKHLRSDGRFHPSYRLARGGFEDSKKDSGTVTGRTSASDPAVQCLIGGCTIYSNHGIVTIESMVTGVETGTKYQVLTHDGSWREVIGSYRNGVQPVFRVSLVSGLEITCTANHPLLTSMGFTRTDHLVCGDQVYTWSSHGESRESSRGGIQSAKGAEEGTFRQEAKMAMSMQLRSGEGAYIGGTEKREGSLLRVLEGSKADQAWAQHSSQDLSNLRGVVPHGPEMHQPEEQGLRPVHGTGCGHLRELDGIPELPSRYGGGASGEEPRSVSRHGRELLQGELQMGNPNRPSSEPEVQRVNHTQRGDQNDSGMGREHWARPQSLLPLEQRVEPDSGYHHAKEAEDAGFTLDVIKWIEYVGEAETFDITVDGSHSFVANGLVVHNTVPKHTKWAKRLRRAMIPPPGKTILQIDYSQGELKITACLAEEPVMIAAYRNGADLHAITAAQLSGYKYTDFMLLPDDVRDELRSGGKAGNFGLIYGMGATGFQDYAYTTYGVKMTENEAVQKRTAFFELYKRLPEWHTEYKNFAKRNGFVRSPLGRIRHLPLITSRDREAQAQAERQSINSPVQSCLSDMMQLAMIMIDKAYGDQVEMFMMTHDACAFYVPIDDAVIWAKRLKEIMDNLPLKEMFGWDHQLQFTTDAECCTPDADGVLSFAYLKKLKGL